MPFVMETPWFLAIGCSCSDAFVLDAGLVWDVSSVTFAPQPIVDVRSELKITKRIMEVSFYTNSRELVSSDSVDSMIFSDGVSFTALSEKTEKTDLH